MEVEEATEVVAVAVATVTLSADSEEMEVEEGEEEREEEEKETVEEEYYRPGGSSRHLRIRSRRIRLAHPNTPIRRHETADNPCRSYMQLRSTRELTEDEEVA